MEVVLRLYYGSFNRLEMYDEWSKRFKGLKIEKDVI